MIFNHQKSYCQPEQIYQKGEVPFENIQKYIQYYTSPGDWIIPLSNANDYVFEDSVEDILPYKSNQECMEIFDQRLLKIYRRSNDSIDLKNIKKIFGQNADMKGLIGKLALFCEGANKVLRRLPNSLSSKIYNTVTDKYDSYLIDKHSNIVPNIIIWVPVWNITSDKATVISLFERIHFIFS